MSLRDLDPVLSTPKKLAAMGVLANARDVEFSFLREHLELSDSDLSKQMRALTEVGYVTVKKRGRGAERRTWFRATNTGSAALRSHIKALNGLVLESLPPPTPPLQDAVDQAETIDK